MMRLRRSAIIGPRKANGGNQHCTYLPVDPDQNRMMGQSYELAISLVHLLSQARV